MKSFLRSDGIIDYYIILLQKCRGLSERPHISLLGCKNLPQIWGKSLHGGQKHASDSGHIYAQGAETCLRFRAYLCTGSRNMPQIRDISMHRVQKHASDSGHTYARGVETCLRFGTYLCTGGRNMPQIQGIILPGVQNLPPDLGHINEIPKWSAASISN
jgi:hypothetical protein